MSERAEKDLRKLEVELVPIEAIRPYERNPRKNDEAVGPVAESIGAFDFQSPILCDADGVILAGHTRYKAAKRLGMERAPVAYIRDLAPVEARAYRLADNRVGEGTGWNIGRLKEELKAVGRNFRMERFGFGEKELKALRDEFRVDMMAEMRETETGKKVEPGQIWRLGNHILQCGDGTDGRSNAELLGGGLADMAITRPHFDDRGRTERLMRQALVHSDGAVYFHVKPPFLSWAKPAWESAGGTWSTFVLNAGTDEPGPMAKHSFSAWLYGWNAKRKHWFCGERNKSDVWEFKDTERASWRLQFVGEAMANSSVPDSTVFDPCSGDGDTLIAAEMGCRRAVCVEADPEVCGRAIARWEAFTHREAEKIT